MQKPKTEETVATARTTVSRKGGGDPDRAGFGQEKAFEFYQYWALGTVEAPRASQREKLTPRHVCEFTTSIIMRPLPCLVLSTTEIVSASISSKPPSAVNQ